MTGTDLLACAGAGRVSGQHDDGVQQPRRPAAVSPPVPLDVRPGAGSCVSWQRRPSVGGFVCTGRVGSLSCLSGFRRSRRRHVLKFANNQDR